MERLKTNVVPPEGPISAKMLFIGEAPGEEEDRFLKPFVGSAGQLLNRCLGGAGIIRSECLITNIFNQQPPRNNIGYYFADKSCTKPTWEGEEHIQVLKEWLEAILRYRENTGDGPNIIVALGKIPTYILTGKKRITKWRGSVLPCTLVPGFKVYAMNHPSYVNRLMNEKEERKVGVKKKQAQNALPTFLIDLERAKEQSEFPSLERPYREYEISLGLDSLLTRIKALNQASIVGVDIETIPTDIGPIVWCIGFAPSPEKAFTVPIIKSGKLLWTRNEEFRLWLAISELFLNKNVIKAFQNGGYDLSILGRDYGLRCENYQDIMWCHQATYPDLMKGLDYLTSVYTWEPYYKDDGKYWDGRRISDEAEYTYNTKDCAIQREIWSVVEREAKRTGKWKTYSNHIEVMPSLLAMMIHGVKYDIAGRDKLIVFLDERIKEAMKIIVEEAGDSFNPNSPKQMQRLLYGQLGLEFQYSHKTHKPTADKDALNRLKRKYPEHPILQALLDYSKFAKLRTTYATMKIDIDGRIRTSYGFISTFRLDSFESHFGSGGNLQNIPKRTEEGLMVRRLFIPDDPLIMLASDLAQAEARFVAWDSQDWELVEDFLAGKDVHWEEAKRIFGLELDQPYEPDEKILPGLDGIGLKKMKELRNLAKSVVHATNYGMGPRMLQTILIREGVYLTFALCKALLASAMRARPLRAAWQGHIREEIRNSRTLRTPLGDVREFRGRINDNLYRAAYAFRPQSTVGRIVEKAIQDIHTDLDYYQILLNVHDEVVGQCLKEDTVRAMRDIKERMERPIEVGGKELIIPCDFKVGPNWGDLKEVTL